jgi:hypothetical protein
MIMSIEPATTLEVMLFVCANVCVITVKRYQCPCEFFSWWQIFKNQLLREQKESPMTQQFL